MRRRADPLIELQRLVAVPAARSRLAERAVTAKNRPELRSELTFGATGASGYEPYRRRRCPNGSSFDHIGSSEWRSAYFGEAAAEADC